MDENKATDVVETEEEFEKKNKRGKKEKPVLTEEQIKKRNSRKTKGAVAVFILILGIGVMGNWYYQNSDLSSNIEPLISSKQTKTLGEAEYVDATAEIKDDKSDKDESEYFSKARVDRQTARDSTLDSLKDALQSTEDEKEKEMLTEKIAKVTNFINIENKIETLVTAKGIKTCIAVINDAGERVDIIVDVDDLNEKTIVQIKDIAIEQLGCDYKNVSIIQANK